jgi:hypothetical protein
MVAWTFLTAANSPWQNVLAVHKQKKLCQPCHLCLAMVLSVHQICHFCRSTSPCSHLCLSFSCLLAFATLVGLSFQTFDLCPLSISMELDLNSSQLHLHCLLAAPIFNKTSQNLVYEALLFPRRTPPSQFQCCNNTRAMQARILLPKSQRIPSKSAKEKLHVYKPTKQPRVAITTQRRTVEGCGEAGTTPRLQVNNNGRAEMFTCLFFRYFLLTPTEILLESIGLLPPASNSTVSASM